MIPDKSLDAENQEWAPRASATAASGSGATVPWPLLAVMATALAVVSTFLWLGVPSGHDFEFHVNSWIEVVGQWKHGTLYPRWAALAQYGYGEARFIFYPPLSWTLGAALGAFLPWKLVPGVYIWLALSLSGSSMFYLARRWMPAQDAVFAAMLYAANPYYLVIVYWRSAFAELLAGALLPLLLLSVLDIERPGRKASSRILALSAITALAWLINIPAAVMAGYSSALLLLIVAIRLRLARVLAVGTVALLLGFLLAAFYLVPVIHERLWASLTQVLSSGLRPQENFLFATTSDPDHNRFNRLVSLVACAEIAIVAVAVFRARLRRLKLPGWWEVTGWMGLCCIVMLPLSLVAWNHLPELAVVQFPWRWLLCLNVGFALLIPIAWRGWLSRAIVYILMLGVLIFVWHRVQPPWWDSAGDIVEMADNQNGGIGYEGVDEYVPANADSSGADRDAPRVMVEENDSAKIQIQRWDPESRSFQVNASKPERLIVKLFNYPAWRVQINGKAITTETLDPTGQMIIPVPAGKSAVSIKLAPARDRAVGGIISGVTALGMLVWIWLEQRRQVRA